jgi:hypothetical protein
MKPKDIFSLAVRLFGLIFVYHALQVLPAAAGQFFLAFPQFRVGAMFVALLTVGWPIVVSYWFLRGAPLIVRTAYPEAEAVQPAPVASAQP